MGQFTSFGYMYQDKVKELGLKEAFKWRDNPYKGTDTYKKK